MHVCMLPYKASLNGHAFISSGIRVNGHILKIVFYTVYSWLLFLMIFLFLFLWCFWDNGTRIVLFNKCQPANTEFRKSKCFITQLRNCSQLLIANRGKQLLLGLRTLMLYAVHNSHVWNYIHIYNHNSSSRESSSYWGYYTLIWTYIYIQNTKHIKQTSKQINKCIIFKN